MGTTQKNYQKALEGRNIPILVLDEKWKLLFGEEGMSPELEEKAAELKEMTGRQEKLREEIKDIKRLKRKLMGEIMTIHDRLNKEGPGSSASKELDDHTRLINDCNDRLESKEDELMDLPREMYQLNYELMLETMQVCYGKLHQNSAQITQIEGWLREVRVELKKQLIHKQESELENFNLYSYMHDIFGPEVIEIFDMQYDPDQKHPIRTMNGDSRKGILD